MGRPSLQILGAVSQPPYASAHAQNPQFSNSNPRPTVFNPDCRHAVAYSPTPDISLHALVRKMLGSGNSIFRNFVFIQLYLSHSNTEYVKRQVILCSTTLVYHSHIGGCDLDIEPPATVL